MPKSAVPIENDHAHWSTVPDTDNGQATSNFTAPESAEHLAPNEHSAKPVHFKVDDIEHAIKPGSYSVTDIKHRFGVALDYALEQVIDGKFCPIDDKADVTIHGGEAFISHVKRGGSS